MTYSNGGSFGSGGSLGNGESIALDSGDGAKPDTGTVIVRGGATGRLLRVTEFRL